MPNFQVVKVIQPPYRYYRNQVQDTRGDWRDVAPEFFTLPEATEAANVQALASDRPVRILEFVNKESN